MGQPARTGVAYPEYLAAGRNRDVKHEYLDGVERAMGDGTIEHGRLTSRFGRLLGARLGDRACEVFSSDVRVRVEVTNRAFYPDLSVVCGAIERSQDDPEAITNPVVIVEVVSDSSEGHDRGEKFRHYRRLESLKEYVLVSQTLPLIEVWRREGDMWRVVDCELEGTVRLTSVDVAFPVADVYRDPLQ
jgi:Uma2 family endonuclease